MKREWTVRENPTAYPDIKTYTILEPNPDAGKSGVCYSGSHFSVAFLDSKEDAQLIAAAPDMYEALKRIKALIDSGDWQLPKRFCESEVNWINSALAKAEGKDGN